MNFGAAEMGGHWRASVSSQICTGFGAINLRCRFLPNSQPRSHLPHQLTTGKFEEASKRRACALPVCINFSTCRRKPKTKHPTHLFLHLLTFTPSQIIITLRIPQPELHPTSYIHPNTNHSFSPISQSETWRKCTSPPSPGFWPRPPSWSPPRR